MRAGGASTRFVGAIAALGAVVALAACSSRAPRATPAPPTAGATARRAPATAATVTTTATTTSATTAPASTTTATTPRPSTTARPAPTTATSPPIGAAPVVRAAGLGALRGVTVAIDAGHDGGNAAHATEIARPIWIGTQYRACDTTGTQGSDGYTEHAYNLDVASRLRAVLVAAGARVVRTRASDSGWGPCIDERAFIANRARAAVAISIHADGGPSDGRGFHVNMPALIPGYTDDIYAASHRLGVAVRDAMATTGMPPSTYIGASGLVERRDFGGLNLSDVPKVLLETGNMRNATDLARLETSAFRQREADAIAAALARFVAGG